MSEPAVVLRDITKIFPGSRDEADVVAVDHVNLEIPRGEFFTLLGPSGCGKTTTLRMIAGFEMPTSGNILLDGRSVENTPPNKRPVNTVFQNYALFPHLSVAQNVAFGLRSKRVPAAEQQDRVAQALELVRLPGMGARRPNQLSGGQQQRVALARALVNRPTVLLLDEPLGALDLKLRKAVQLELKQLQSSLGITFIYVTHDQEEALTMSNRIAVMNDGRVMQVGTPREIYEFPVNRFVADFIGETNFLSGRVRKSGDLITLEVEGVMLQGHPAVEGIEVGSQATLALRPEKMNLYPLGKLNVFESEMGLGAKEFARVFGGKLDNAEIDVRDYLAAESDSVVLPATIREAIYIGTDIRYMVELANRHQLIVRVQNFGQRYDTIFAVGDEVLVHWPAENGRVLAG